jgi:lysozyme
MKNMFTPLALAVLLFACDATKETERSADSVPVHDTAAQHPAAPSGGPAFLYGIDISSYQGDEADFLNKKSDSLSFVICRATLGITFTDADFANNWKMIQQEGFVRGAYHFYECDDDPKKQAQHYLTVIGTLGANDLPPILDFEQAGLAGVTDKQSIQSNLLIFLNTVEAATGRTPLIYVSPDFSNEYLSDPAFAKYPLYVADYNGKSQPSMPATWQSSQWTFWQKTDTVHVDGNQNDFDIFNGNAAALQAFVAKGSK